MKNLTLDANQRLRLEFLLGSQKGTVSEMRRLDRILTKLELSTVDKDCIGLSEQAGVYRWNPVALEAIGPIELQLEDAEVEAILHIMKDCHEFTRSDIRGWVDKTMSMLE